MTRAVLWPLIVLILCRVQVGRTQQPACDPGLRPRPQTPYAYRPLADRCEGIYVEQVGGTVLSVASLTASFEKYDLTSGKSLRLAWPGRGNRELRIRVRGIQPELYYGMDATRPANSTSYQWPISILASLRIVQSDIGVLGWTRRQLGNSWRNVYLPLRISQAGTPAAGHGYSLVLYPGVKLQEVYLTLGPADGEGRPMPGKLVKDHQPLNQGFYPAERPVRIKLPALRPPGLYYLEVSATLPSGSPVSVPSLLFDTSEP
jgi:hypothetical protein